MNLSTINHIVEDMQVLSGGVPAVVRQLTRRLSSSGHKTSVTYCLGDASDLNDISRTVCYPPSGSLSSWSHSPGLDAALSNLSSSDNNQSSIYHIHGIWKAPQILAARSCHRSSVPFLFSIHGMLEPWLWNRQGAFHKIKKTLFWSLYAKQSISNSSIIHAITPLERDHLYALLPASRIEVIPNAIDLSPIVPDKASSRKKNFLFLGRLEPKKGIDILINAFALSRLGPEWSLDIVGPPWSNSYLSSLKRLVHRYQLSDCIHFHGSLLGDDKKSFLESSWAMVTPSHSEVVGLVNLEAADHLLPSITTHQTGLNDWLDGGGLLVSPEVLPLSNALIQASLWSSAEQFERGLASRLLVEKRYSWSSVMPLWEDLYSTISS